MTEKRKVPIFLGEDDEQIQIGTAKFEDCEWHNDPGFMHVLVHLDVFPGEHAVLTRLVDWEEVVKYANVRYPRKEEL